MNNLVIVCEFFPLIKDCRDNGYSYNYILSLINEQGFNINLNSMQYYFNKLINKKLFNTNVICFNSPTDNDFLDYSINEYGLWFSHKDFKKYIKQEFLIKKDNIADLKSFEAIILAKYFLNLFDLPTLELCNNFSKEKINIINFLGKITDEFDKISSECKSRHLKHKVFTNFNFKE